MYIEQEDILKHISAKPFHLISEAADGTRRSGGGG